MSRYAEAHKDSNITGPGDARPTALQVLQDEGAEGKLVGKVIVITGCSSGIGVETARVLSLTGAKLFLTARNLEKAKTALGSVLEPGRVELVEMDNTSLASVRAAAADVLKRSNGQVNILINNAGIMAVPTLQHTKDGFEMQFGVNHLSHFLFFNLLKDALLASASPELSSRVVCLTSSAHNIATIQVGNYNFEKEGSYYDWVAYGQSKTANLYMANEIERRYGSKGLHANGVHPGVIHTGLTQFIPADNLAEMSKNKETRRKMKSVEQGAATTVWAAIGKEWETKGGEYLADVGKTVPADPDANPVTRDGHAPHAYHPEHEARLWKDSLKMVGLPDDE
ncbi:alcohol dehydrogenase [Diaporthe helianthi]|uniref:Alcohol dehydrogenase n=1 Tax=Diaporthe helianthi TaxID=158607 RepID=A0A2P5I228_DIAHE|nr:alcohol dehydrogenase [Diaporthe helianthi]